MSRVKIVATIGPQTASEHMLRALYAAGMDVARLNGSHADPDWHTQTIRLIRATLPDVPILFDLPGRKIRTRRLRHEPTFNAGDTIVLTTDESHDGQVKVPVTCAQVPSALSGGDVIVADDGTLRFTVSEVTGTDIICRAEFAGRLRSNKGINLPGVALDPEPLSDRDRRMITFAAEQGIDFVGVSFVDSAAQVNVIREFAGTRGVRIVSKIECQEAIDHLREILEASDAAMVDRGDLSAETNLEGMALLAKRIIAEARQAARPVIIATEMLHSMIENPFPTKAEVSDISNAVLDGASALMLSGETAVGRFPVEAVAVMRRIADTVTAHSQALLDREHQGGAEGVPQAMEDAIALICRRLPVTKIVAITMLGYAARMVSSRLPRQPILAVSNDPAAARSFNLLPGTEGVHVDIPFSRTSTDHLARCLEALWRSGKLVDDDLVLVTSVGYPKSGNRMNLIQTHYVADLRDSLGWD